MIFKSSLDTTLQKEIEKNRRAYVNIKNRKVRAKEGVIIEIYPGETSPIALVTKDLLGNEIYITKFHLEEHLRRPLGENHPKAKQIIEKLLKSPEFIFDDQEKGAILYGRFYKDINRYYFAVVGKDTRRLFTIERKPELYRNRQRYAIIFGKEK